MAGAYNPPVTTRPLKEYAESDERYWYVSPERYLALLAELREAAPALDPPPDSVVGIKRSGLFPAVYLSHQLKLPMLTDGEAKVFPYPKFSRPLVVDTAIWSGKSARRVVERLRRRGVEQIRVLAMFAREDPRPEVDGLHYLELTDRIIHFWYDETKEEAEP